MPVGEVGDEEGDRVGEGAPGEEVRQVDRPQLRLNGELDEVVGGRDDGYHGGDRHHKASEHILHLNIRGPASDRRGGLV